MRVFRVIACVFLGMTLVGIGLSAHTSQADEEVGVDEHLGAVIPLDVPFLDEDGKKVLLKDLFDRPIILNLVYYKCTSICGPVLSGVASVIDGMKIRPGSDYRVVTISFNEQEGPDLAKAKQANFIKSLRTPIDPADWRFLTGQAESIKAVADAIGFKFKKVDDDFIHAAAVFAVSKDGKIARYLYGTSFLPMDMTLALLEASQGHTVPSIRKVLLYCFKYDPAGRTYVFKILPIAGGVVLLMAGSFAGYLFFSGRRRLTKGCCTKGEGSA